MRAAYKQAQQNAWSAKIVGLNTHTHARKQPHTHIHIHTHTSAQTCTHRKPHRYRTDPAAEGLHLRRHDVMQYVCKYMCITVC